MNKYRVYGHTTVTVTIEVEANNEAEGYQAAADELYFLSAYAGNGGLDRLIGVDGENESSVNADEEITYDDIELLGPAE
ncbi:MAG TPA: hypothetical protein DEP23_11160, partial [Ruminococcaceae bacterium]|nr:hypothetical protein [Oscillospiraceae bacterium]